MPALLPSYEQPPEWIPHEQRYEHPDYDNDLRDFLPRVLTIRRERAEDTLGFNIRGGAADACGIFISKVLVSSEASKQGLKEGDQILAVNETSFENIDHHQAVRVLKGDTNTHLVVRFAPFAYRQTYERIPTAVSVPTPPQQPPSPQYPNEMQYPPQQGEQYQGGPQHQGAQGEPQYQGEQQYQQEPQYQREPQYQGSPQDQGAQGAPQYPQGSAPQYPSEPGPPQYQRETQYSDERQYPAEREMQHQQQQQRDMSYQQQYQDEADQYVPYRP